LKYRISKYNPKYRIDGKYVLDDWTSINDVGRFFDGKRLHGKTYLEMEKRYINCIMDLLKQAKEKFLCIMDYEDYSHSFPTLKNAFRMTLLLKSGVYFFQKVKWSNKQVLPIETVPLFLKDCLRDKCWGVLRGDFFQIDIGYDYYIHISTKSDIEMVRLTVSKYELFIETVKGDGSVDTNCGRLCHAQRYNCGIGE